MNKALILVYVLVAVRLLVAANKHGKLRPPEKYDFAQTVIHNALNLVLCWWLLGWRFI